ncbi:hypothetical protein BJX64DRAFT_256817 [Aspergillus heterothallicus]
MLGVDLAVLCWVSARDGCQEMPPRTHTFTLRRYSSGPVVVAAAKARDDPDSVKGKNCFPLCRQKSSRFRHQWGDISVGR